MFSTFFTQNYLLPTRNVTKPTQRFSSCQNVTNREKRTTIGFIQLNRKKKEHFKDCSRLSTLQLQDVTRKHREFLPIFPVFMSCYIILFQPLPAGSFYDTDVRYSNSSDDTFYLLVWVEIVKDRLRRLNCRV